MKICSRSPSRRRDGTVLAMMDAMTSSARIPAPIGDPATAQRPPTGLRAMIIEDETPLADLVGSYLERDGFEVTITADGVDAVALARQVDPDVVVLDLGLPGLDGVEVCRQLRTFSDAYVVMLTARTEEIDTLIGLSVGADDYMSKPFSPRELMARVQAMLRRPRPRTTAPGWPAGALPTRTFGDLSLDVDGREVAVGGTPVALTRTEFDILAALARDPGVVLTRAQLIDAVWGPNWISDEHLVAVHIGHLRRKLGDDATRGRYVRTVRGVGYRMGTGT
ncbi:response regulator transcription factor [Mycolicibacterium alvei]|uniref:Two component transcriptional regulator n=3 Tax=Mycobacteriaceae TaxID=1762 RepID=A0A3S5EIL2_MYCCI|nr:putative sensory transduction protein [Mycolicibacterium alvei]VEG49410.1 two component transcriptional regulator [Mycolicibacterium chitae]